MKVVELPVGNLLDIPAMMRRVADYIERGEHGAPEHAVLILTEGARVQTFHWGPSVTRRYMAGLFMEQAIGSFDGETDI